MARTRSYRTSPRPQKPRRVKLPGLVNRGKTHDYVRSFPEASLVMKAYEGRLTQSLRGSSSQRRSAR